MKNFEGKVVIVTGASSGIGLEISRQFAQAGASVVMLARSIDKLTKSVEEFDGDHLAIKCDVTSVEDCQNAVNKAVEKFGRVDVLVNNAGLSMRALFDDVDLDVLHRLMDVNFWGTVNCTKFALPYIQASKGSIIGISSVAGYHGLPARTGYSASKYAMHGFLETIRIENLRKGVHVMIAAPGFVESNVRFSALTADGSAQGESPREEGKMMTASEVARRVVRATAKRKRSLLMDFNGRATNILKKFAPRLLDKLFFNHMASEPDSPLKR